LKKIIFILSLLLFAEIASSQNFFSTPIRLTSNTGDKNPVFRVSNTDEYVFNWEFMAFERTLSQGSEIFVVKVGQQGTIGTEIKLSNTTGINRNPSIAYNYSLSGQATYALVVWEYINNGNVDLYACYYDTASGGWNTPFVFSNSAYDEKNPRAAFFYDGIFGVAFEKNNDIIFIKYNVQTHNFVSEINITVNDNLVCSNPFVIAPCRVNLGNAVITYEREIASGQKAIFYRIGFFNTCPNYWRFPDTLVFSGHNINAGFIPGSQDVALAVYEKLENGKSNIFGVDIQDSLIPNIGCTLIRNNNYTNYSYNSRIYPIPKNNIPDNSFYGYLRRASSITEAVIKNGNYFADSSIITISNNPAFKTSVIMTSKLLNTSNSFKYWIAFARDSVSGNSPGIFGSNCVVFTTGIENQSEFKNPDFILHQNFPNPFNSFTNIKFELKKAAKVKINIYDVNGKLIESFLNTSKPAGIHQILFEANNISSGIYFYSLTVDDIRIDTKKLILMK
jgi:hypothetical protein